MPISCKGTWYHVKCLQCCHPGISLPNQVQRLKCSIPGFAFVFVGAGQIYRVERFLTVGSQPAWSRFPFLPVTVDVPWSPSHLPFLDSLSPVYDLHINAYKAAEPSILTQHFPHYGLWWKQFQRGQTPLCLSNCWHTGYSGWTCTAITYFSWYPSLYILSLL